MGPDVIRTRGAGVNIVGVFTRDNIDNGDNCGGAKAVKDSDHFSVRRIGDIVVSVNGSRPPPRQLDATSCATSLEIPSRDQQTAPTVKAGAREHTTIRGEDECPGTCVRSPCNLEALETLEGRCIQYIHDCGVAPEDRDEPAARRPHG